MHGTDTETSQVDRLTGLLEPCVPVLEDALGDFDPKIAELKPSLRLRMRVCGITGETIREYLAGVGVVVEPKARSCPWIESWGPPSEHVVEMTPETDPTIIDAAYSRFFEPVGLTIKYAERVGRQVFPNRKILTFRASDADEITSGLAEFAYTFQQEEQGYPEFADHPKPDGFVPDLTLPELQGYFGEIWRLSAYQDAEPGSLIRQNAPRIASRLRDAVSV